MKPVSRARKAFDWVVGLTLILGGVAGLVLPGLQGILMILAGLAVLSSHSVLARRVNDRLKLWWHQARERVLRRSKP